MSQAQITAEDVVSWETLDDIATALEKRGLKPRWNLDRENGFEDELLVEIEENKYIALIDAAPGDDPGDYNKFQSSAVPTTFVSTQDFQTFSIIRRKRIIGGDKHGRLDRQKFSFDKEQISSGDRYSVLDKLNDIEYGDESSFDNLFDTRQVVDEFYEEFESIRTDLVDEVEGIDDGRGDAKQRYVQVTLNRLIFLHFIQEKGLLGAGEDDYLLTKHNEFAADSDVQTDFYEPLFFKALGEEGFQNRKFDRVPYLNGGLFSETRVEQEFDSVRLGADANESDDLYREILEFLDSWNWNVDERLDVVEPKNLSPAVLGHIFEQSVNQQEIGAYYTPEEVTHYMARWAIHERLVDRVNKATGGDYESLDAVFGFDEEAGLTDQIRQVVADGGTALTVQPSLDAAPTEDIETLYFEILPTFRVLDPAVGSGAFLLAAEEVLLDIYLHAIEHFEQLADQRPLAASDRVLDEVEAVQQNSSKLLYAKREIILNNLYGVDIDTGAVEICKLRLWLSMVAHLRNNPDRVEPLPNIDFNIREGNSLIGYAEAEIGGGDASGATDLGDWDRQARFEEVKKAVKKYKDPDTSLEVAKEWQERAAERIAKHRPKYDERLVADLQAVADDGEEIDDETVSSWEPFHWPIEFAEVSTDGGFDVAIGNPPYEGQDKHDYKTHLQSMAVEEYGYEYTAKTDLFQFFVHRGVDLLADAATYSYIMNDTFLMNRNKGDVRRTLLPHLTEITTVNPNAFDVSVDTAIFRGKLGQDSGTVRYNGARETATDTYPRLDTVDLNHAFSPISTENEYHIKRATVGEIPVYRFDRKVYEDAYEKIFYEPSETNVDWYRRFFSPVMETYANWEKQIGNVRSLRASKTEVCREYLSDLESGDICLFGLYAEGGRGVKTDGITEYVGVREDTQKEEIIHEQGYYNRSDSQITMIVSEEDVADPKTLSDTEQIAGIEGDCCWVPAHRSIKSYDKFYAPVDEYMHWSEDKVSQLKEATSLTNSQAYFTEIIGTKQGGGVRNSTWRLFPPGVVLNTVLGYQPLTPNEDADFDFDAGEEVMSLRYVLGILNSTFIDNLMDNLLNRVGQTTVGTRLLPIVVPTPEQEQRVEELVEEAVDLQQERDEQLDQPDEARLKQVISEIDTVVEEIYDLNGGTLSD